MKKTRLEQIYFLLNIFYIFEFINDFSYFLLKLQKLKSFYVNINLFKKRILKKKLKNSLIVN